MTERLDAKALLKGLGVHTHLKGNLVGDLVFSARETDSTNGAVVCHVMLDGFLGPIIALPQILREHAEMADELARIVLTASALIAVIDEALPEINRHIALSDTHGEDYRGPNISPALEALRSALAGQPVETADQRRERALGLLREAAARDWDKLGFAAQSESIRSGREDQAIVGACIIPTMLAFADGLSELPKEVV